MRKGLMVMTLAAAFTAGMAMTSFAGWSQKNGNWYYYNDSTGKMVQDDWVKVNEKWYYMDSNGVMATGVRTIDGKRYVFSPSGAYVPVSAAHADPPACAARSLSNGLQCSGTAWRCGGAP